MPRKFFIVLLGLILLSPSYAEAGLVINEIMYDLSGSDSASSKSREWIEIYNPDAGPVSIDASSWRIYDGGANRTINGEADFSVPAGAYVIFAGDKDTFLTDHPGFSGTVYDTGISSLNNTGATLKLSDQDGNALDTVIYASSQGGAGDGNTLQKISSTWQGGTPTPGIQNEETASPPSGNGSGSVGGSGTEASDGISQNETKKKIEYREIKTKIVAKTPAFVSLPIFFNSVAYGHSGEELFAGRYFWNFGDGDSREVKGSDKASFTHTYFYPGEYIVSLEYYRNHFSEIPDASDEVVLKVVSADLVISNVGDEKDFFIEISNNAGYDADLSKWILASANRSFIFPKNTVLGSKKELMLSPRLTGFSFGDKSSLKLLNPQGEVIFDYNSSITPTLVLLSSPAEVSQPSTSSVNNQRKENYIEVKEDNEVSLEETDVANLSADVSLSEVGKEISSNSYTPMVVFAFFLAGSVGGIYFIRRKASIAPGEDFSILDE